MTQVRIKKLEHKKQVAIAEVYAPDIMDAHGHFMTADEIERMAYNFMKSGRLDCVDVQHDNNMYGCHVVESFIARDDDTVFIPKSWVVAVHIPDPDLWKKVENGEINAFSMEVLAVVKSSEMQMELPALLTGDTEEEEDHKHRWYAILGENGEFLGGFTNIVQGHQHTISTGTMTDIAKEHEHKYNFADAVIGLVDNEEEV